MNPKPQKSTAKNSAEDPANEQNIEDATLSNLPVFQLLNSIPNALLISDQENKIVLVNKHTENIFAYEKAELLKQKIEILLPKNSHNIYAEHCAKLFSEASAYYHDLSIELFGLRKDGSEFPARLTLSLMETDQGPFVLHTICDMSQLKNIEQKLKQSQAELEQFVSITAHDLKVPIQTVYGCLRILENKYKNQLDPKAEELIYQSVNESLRMSTIIDDLLCLCRINNTGQTAEKVDFNELLSQVIQGLELPLKESGAKITHGVLPTLIVVKAQISQLFQNLINNALKYHSDKCPEIRIKAERKGSEWIFSVSDNGIGFEQKYSERIFEPFKRLHTRDEYQGNGIGLAICQKIVKQHNGSIWAESEPRKGSTFFFSISDNKAVGN